MLRNWEILYFVCLLYLESVQKKLSCRRRIIKSLFEKLCPAVNYGAERYIFSHKSVALSALVRCKFSFYFLGGNPPHAWFLSPKTCLDTKKNNFFQKHIFWSFCWKHTEQDRWKLIQNIKFHELCAVMKGLDNISLISSFHFTLVSCHERCTIPVPQKSSPPDLQSR